MVVEARLTMVDGFMEMICDTGRTISVEHAVSASMPLTAILRQTVPSFDRGGAVHLSSSADCCAGTATSSKRQAIESEEGKAPFTVKVLPPLVETDDGASSLIEMSDDS
jgi:hypothetical protein